MKLSEAIELIAHKAKEAPECYRSKAAALYWAANQLWSDEYSSWRAACSALGPYSGAAECAWERRTAYSELSSILLKTW
ncbi:MAG: hypothetical protein ACO3S8_05505 [Aquiluna sp.]